MRMLLLISILHCQLLAGARALPPQADTLPPKQEAVTARLMPNPVKNRCELLVKNFSAGELWVTIYSSGGAVVYRAKRLVITATDRIVLFLQLPPGNYVCSVAQQQKKARLSFVVAP